MNPLRFLGRLFPRRRAPGFVVFVDGRQVVWLCNHSKLVQREVVVVSPNGHRLRLTFDPMAVVFTTDREPLQ